MFVLDLTVDYIKEFGGSYLTVSNPNHTLHVDVEQVLVLKYENENLLTPVWDGNKDWTILYEQPQTLFDVLRNDVNRDISRFDNVFLCPSFSNLDKKNITDNIPF